MMVLKELDIKVRQPISVKEDNEVKIKLGENNMTSARNKHVGLRHHVIGYHINKGTIKLEYVPASRMIVDMITKTNIRTPTHNAYDRSTRRRKR